MKVAVVGASLAGLAAGALLARRGCQVTVFEADAQPGGLGDGPALKGINRLPGDHLIWGWRSSRPLMRLFGALKDHPGATARHLLQPVPTGLQALGHPHRLDWGERLAEEIGREFPAALASWTACAQEWDREALTLGWKGVGHSFLMSGQRPTEAMADGEPEDQRHETPPPDSGEERQAMEEPFAAGPVKELPREIRHYLNGVVEAVCWRPLEEVTQPAGLWAMKMTAQEVAVLRDGVDGLMRWLAGRLEAAGGSLRLGTRVRALKTRGGRVRGISIREGRRRSTEPAERVVVAGGEPSHLLPLGRFRTQGRRTIGNLVTCLLAVEEGVIPEPLAPLAAYCPAPEEPVLLLSHNPASLHTLKDMSRRFLMVSWLAEAPGADSLTIPEELTKRLERLMPFLPGRWELVPQDDASGSPLVRRPIPEIDQNDFNPTTTVGGLVKVARHPLPGTATTVSLTLGVAAAEAILRGL